MLEKQTFEQDWNVLAKTLHDDNRIASRMEITTEASVITSTSNIRDLLRPRPEVRPRDPPADRLPTGNWPESSATTRRLRSTGSCRRSCSSKSFRIWTSFHCVDVLKYETDNSKKISSKICRPILCRYKTHRFFEKQSYMYYFKLI